jgi:hypothetical protein
MTRVGERWERAQKRKRESDRGIVRARARR